MNISEECFKEIIEMVEALIEEADHHANKKNPVVKITDKNYQVASGKSLPGPFNKNHVGQYIVYNKDTDASYLVTPDNWKKSKIKKDLESQGKFYEALEETMKLLELFDRPDLLDDIDTLLGSPVKKTFKKMISNIGAPKKEKKGTQKKIHENFDNSKEISYNIEEALSLIEAIINEVSPNFTFPKIESTEKEVKDITKQEKEEKDPIKKKELGDKRVKLEHKLNATKDHVFNYHANQLKKEEAERNAEKNKEQ